MSIKIAIDTLTYGLGSAQASQRAYLDAHPNVDVKKWQGYWDARDGNDAGIPNSGTVGSALNASNTGMVKVEGPALVTLGPVGINSAYVPIVPTHPSGNFNVSVRWKVASLTGNPSALLLINTRTVNNGFIWRINQTSHNVEVLVGNGSTLIQMTHTSLLTKLAAVGVNPDMWVDIGNSYIGDNGAGGKTSNLYWKLPTESTWKLLDSVTTATAINMVAVGSPITIHLPCGEAVSPVPVGDCVYRGVSIKTGSTGDMNGTAYFELTENDIPTDPSVTSFVCSTGQTITINRGTANAATTIVPAGESTYLNPDNTNGSNFLSAADNAAFDIDTGDDAVLISVFSGKNTVPPSLVTYVTATTDSILIPGTAGMFQRINSLGATSRVNDGTTAPQTNAFTIPDYGDYMMVSILSRSANNLQNLIYDKTGAQVYFHIADATAVTSVSPTGGFRSMRYVAGGIKLFGWNKGVGIAPTTNELSQLAKYLFAGVM